MDKERAWLLKEKYGGVESEAFHADAERLKVGEPLAYIIGHIPFLGCTIYLDSQPLIPRPETEFWAEKAITEMTKGRSLPSARSNLAIGRGSTSPEAAAPLRILDLCAGSGCIGVAVAKHISQAKVDFAEIDAAHLPTIEKNLHANGITADRCQLYKSDLFSNVTGTYDFILSNPPYIDVAADTVEASVTAHEPHRALFGGTDGIEVIEAIITAAPAHLTKGGQLWLEHEPFQTHLITQMARAHGFSIRTETDQYRVLRYSVLMLQ